MIVRPNVRNFNELRPVTITRNYTKHAEGSVLICMGDTHIICNASVVAGLPRWLKGSGQGWLTAEYGMLPRSTKDRMQRDNQRSGQNGRSLEIQRLIGRALRSAVNLKNLGENTIYLDCDVIQADGGTRTASITGACIALYDAISFMKKHNMVNHDPFMQFIASVSVGIYKGEPIVDLDYAEDSNADTDMNIVMTEKGDFVELQGTAEKTAFNVADLQAMLNLAQTGIKQLIRLQKESIHAPLVS